VAELKMDCHNGICQEVPDLRSSVGPGTSEAERIVHFTPGTSEVQVLIPCVIISGRRFWTFNHSQDPDPQKPGHLCTSHLSHFRSNCWFFVSEFLAFWWPESRTLTGKMALDFRCSSLRRSDLLHEKEPDCERSSLFTFRDFSTVLAELKQLFPLSDRFKWFHNSCF
jgi:hypothetical protein